MAVGTGYRNPYVALYANSGTTVTYSSAMSLGRGVNVDWDIEVSDNNAFYADDVLAEEAGGVFTSGSGTATVDGLGQTVARMILGLPATRTVNTVTVQGYGGDMPPYVGFGFIKRQQMQGTVTYLPIIFPKVRFSMPGGSAATQEESIDWQTQELSFSILRDDTSNAEWMIVPTEGMSTDTEALAFITSYFS